jgi:hypothetical protein
MSIPVTGDDDGVGFGVKGSSAYPHTGKGVEGHSSGGDGVFGQTRGMNAAGVRGVHTGHISAIAVIGELDLGITAIKGQHGGGSRSAGDEVLGSGVWGDSSKGPGVAGTSATADGIIGVGATAGVRGASAIGDGVIGESDKGEGVRGISHSLHGGIVGVNDNPGTGAGVFAVSSNGEGVHGESNAATFGAGVTGAVMNHEGTGPGVLGQSFGKGPGVIGKSVKDSGVIGFHGDPQLQETTATSDAGLAGVFGASSEGPGIMGYSRERNSPAVLAIGYIEGRSFLSPLAAFFDGNVQVNGDVCLVGADCAEEFDVAQSESIEAGAVVVVNHEGKLHQCDTAYDGKVAGVVSGAGEYKPGIVLHKRESANERLPIALVGKVYCKVDAHYSAIEVGDLLTTSETPGHAMKASDPSRSFGAVLGKALRAHKVGCGLIPILVALQ